MVKDGTKLHVRTGHPDLQKLFDSFEVISGAICWDYTTMYALRDRLIGPPSDAWDERVAAQVKECREAAYDVRNVSRSAPNWKKLHDAIDRLAVMADENMKGR